MSAQHALLFFWRRGGNATNVEMQGKGATFAPVDGQQSASAIRDFCTAARALQDASDASKASAKAVRERQKRSRGELTEALRRCAGSCVEVCLPSGQPGYARLVARKGGQKRLTASSFADALRSLTQDDVRDGCTPAGITRAAMEKMRGEGKDHVVLTRTPPPHVQVARLPSTSGAGSAYAQAQHELREIGAAKREACQPLKDRCERSRSHVLSHLRAHDPQKLQQQVRLSQGAEDRVYVLRARPKPVRAGRGDTVREAEQTVAAALGERPMAPTDALTHLQSEKTLQFVSEQLRKRLEKLRSEAADRAPLEVSFCPAK